MLNRNDVIRLISDLFRTELARRQPEALAVFDNTISDLWLRIPADIKQAASNKAAVLFGYEPRIFSSFPLMVDYAYASFLKNRQLTFFTAGTTAQPRPCLHTSAMLREEARGVSHLFQGVKRIVSLVPATHWYGFTFTMMLPHILEVPVITRPALPAQSWNSLLQEGDLLVSVPLFWNYWLRCDNQFPRGIQVLSSTAPCKDETITGLKICGATRFTEIYGSGPTGAIAWRTHAGMPFEFFQFWQVNLRNKTPLIRRKSGGNWLSLPDGVSLENDRSFYPITRQDTCVPVAGINVYPKQVEQIISSHPAVKACRVRMMRPEEGGRLKAFIVFNDGYTQQHMGILRTFLARRLSTQEMPRAFTFGEKLPVSATEQDYDW